ncbi:hypothetical protein GQ457_03G038310 [Hibiscus cannabinus]
MEEETKMLKEALTIRNCELLASRNMCVETSSKLQTLQALLVICNQQRSPSKAVAQFPTEVYSSQIASNPPSMTSLSEDGNDDDRSCSESSAIALRSRVSQFKKENSTEKSNKTENMMHLDLMDDFLEMEMLACSSNDPTANAAIIISGCTNDKIFETVKGDASGEISYKTLHYEKQHDLSPPANHISDADKLSVMKLRARLLMVLQSTSRDADMHKILEDIKHAVQDVSETLSQHSVNGVSDGTCNGQAYPGDGSLTEEKNIPMSSGVKVTSETVRQELATALSHIHDFVRYLGKEARAVDDISSDGKGLSYKIDEFLVTYDKAFCSNVCLDDFIFYLSSVLAKASELRFNVLGYEGNEVEISSPDCIAKVVLPENKVTQNNPSGGSYQNNSARISNPSSTEVPDDGNMVSEYQPKQTNEFSSEEFKELRSSGNELQDEKSRHHDAFARCKELEEQLQRNENCSVCSSAADNDLKSKQVRLCLCFLKLVF